MNHLASEGGLALGDVHGIDAALDLPMLQRIGVADLWSAGSGKV
jgi:hypothetical protein